MLQALGAAGVVTQRTQRVQAGSHPYRTGLGWPGALVPGSKPCVIRSPVSLGSAGCPPGRMDSGIS